MSKFVNRVFLFCLFQYSVLGWADGQKVCDKDCVEVGSWSFSVGLGLGVRTNPIASKSDTPLLVLPEVSYYGKRFFFKNLEMGFTLWENPAHQLNILLTPSSDQMHFNRWDLNNFTDGSTASAAPPALSIAEVRESITANPNPSFGGDDRDADAGIGGGSNNSSSSTGDSGGDDTKSSDSLGESVDNGLTGGAALPSLPISDGGGGGAPIFRPIFGEGEGGENSGGSNDSAEKKEDDEVTLLDPSGELASPISPTSPEVPDSPELSEVIDTAEIRLTSRKMAALAGLEYMYTHPRFNLHFQSLFDVSGVHNGHELRFAATVPFESEKNKWAMTLGLNYQSQNVLDYYYGVSATETSHEVWEYKPQSAGVLQLFRLDWQRPVSRHWSWRAMLQYSRLSNEASSSPIVSAPFVATVFVGGVYHF